MLSQKNNLFNAKILYIVFGCHMCNKVALFLPDVCQCYLWPNCGSDSGGKLSKQTGSNNVRHFGENKISFSNNLNIFFLNPYKSGAILKGLNLFPVLHHQVEAIFSILSQGLNFSLFRKIFIFVFFLSSLIVVLFLHPFCQCYLQPN